MTRVIPFSKFGLSGLIISILCTSGLLLITFLNGGFNLGIDFQSGQTIDIVVQNTTPKEVTEKLVGTFEKVQVTRIGNDDVNSYNIKLGSSEESQEEDLRQVTDILTKEFGEVEVLSTAFIGSGISQNLFQSVLVLTLGALGLILLYVWMRFKFQYAVASLFALLHDILFIVGLVGAFKIEVSTSTVAAILTIIGYSLNDTIIIFDRIRENVVLIRDNDFRNITNRSITQTMSRTIITSVTTLLAVLALMIFATGDVYNFARTLAIGIIEGTWSSLFIATPILSLFNHQKLLASSRKGMGSGMQYTSSPSASSPSSGGAQAQISDSKGGRSSISNQEVEKIKAEVLARQKKKKK